MQQKLIIYLPAHGIDCIVADDASNIQHVDASELSPLAQGKQIIVLVPSEDVVLTTVKLPKMNRARLAQALPFALEEQVIGELTTLHFVPGEIQADGDVPVAITSKEKMQYWLAQLQALNIQPDILMPLVFALPREENSWVITLHDTANIRMNAYEGFACDPDNLQALLEIALQLAQEKPECIFIRNYTSHAAALNLSVKVKENFHDAEQFITDHTPLKSPHLNLLNGIYKTRKSLFPETRKVWKAAITLTASFLVLLFLYPSISYFMLKHREHDIDVQIAEIYKHHFPQAANIVAPKIRMQEKMQKYTAQSGESTLLTLAAYIGKGMRKAHGINLKRFSFQHNQMTLELAAASSEDFSMFTDYLMHEGLKVKQDSVNLAGVRVNAVVTVE